MVRNHHIGQDIELLLLVVLLFEVGSRSLLTMAEEGQCKCLLTRLSKDFIASFRIHLPLLSTYSPLLILFLQSMLMLEHEIIATKKDTAERALSPILLPSLANTKNMIFGRMQVIIAAVTNFSATIVEGENLPSLPDFFQVRGWRKLSQ